MRSREGVGLEPGNVDDGLVGVSEVRMVNKTDTLDACINELAPRYVVGSDPFDVERLAWNVQRAEYGRPGEVTQSALAAFDVACWDLMGQALGVPVWKLLGGRFRQKWVLAAIYLARAAVIGLFLMLPLSGASAVAFGAAIGFLWLGTVPLTSGLVARVFGVRYLSMLYGVVFASHQLGAFLGAWGGGLAYDLFGSYDSVWLASIGLALFAALIHLPIDDRPLARLAPA